MKLLLVDGSNILLRCALGGQIAAEQSTPTAIAMIERVARELEATHLVVALDDTDHPSWRKTELLSYKAHRTVQTAMWLIHGALEMQALGWKVLVCPGFEADDIIATIAHRAIAHAQVISFSNDSDLFPLVTAGVEVVRPKNGGGWERMSSADVAAKYAIPSAELLVDYKAMVGEAGDGISGVPAIGPKRAGELLHRFGSLEKIIENVASDRHAAKVAEHAAAARLAQRLITLRTDAPIPPIAPRSCYLRMRSAA